MDYTTPEALHAAIDSLSNGERLAVSGVPEAVYHAAGGIGSTLMRAAMKSMAHYKHELEREREETAEMMIGTATHTLVLEPEHYDDQVVTIPPEYKTNKSKKFDEWAKDYEGKVLLRQEEQGVVAAMADAVFTQVGQYFVNGDPEKSYWYRDEETGLLLKARIDYQIGDAAIDLKTTRKETAQQFNNSVKYDYGPQDSLYRKVTALKDMVFVGISKVEPHQCFLSIHGADCRKANDKNMMEALRAVTLSEQAGDYPSAPVELLETHRASWEK